MLPTLLLAINIAASCESLQTLALPETTILSATLVPEARSRHRRHQGSGSIDLAANFVCQPSR